MQKQCNNEKSKQHFIIPTKNQMEYAVRYGELEDFF